MNVKQFYSQCVKKTEVCVQSIRVSVVFSAAKENMPICLQLNSYTLPIFVYHYLGPREGPRARGGHYAIHT